MGESREKPALEALARAKEPAMAWIDDEDAWREPGETGLSAGRTLYWLATIVAAAMVINFRGRRFLHQLGARSADRAALRLDCRGGGVADRPGLPCPPAVAVSHS
jgi:hypothetical protein